MRCSRRGQGWSTDAIIGITIFMVALIFFFYMLGQVSDRRKFEDLAFEASFVAGAFEKSDNASLRFIEAGNKVNVEKLLNVSSLDYHSLKVITGIDNDFCIFFEDKFGNVVVLNETNMIVGVGSPNVSIGGFRCFKGNTST
ncbi:hypothetical protein HY640_02080 [Candidatus Woesearchaeota archaeon]|nr:hypothetical protein [Candidatus Woesearchaeota archaeon]